MLNPDSPPGTPQPSIRSSMSAGSSCGTLASAAWIICTVRSSGRMLTSEPLLARPIGERAVETMTASGIADTSSYRGGAKRVLTTMPRTAPEAKPKAIHATAAGRIAAMGNKDRVLATRTIVLWGTGLVLVAAVAATVLLAVLGGGTPADSARLDALRTASSIVVGTGGAAALLLAARRQRWAELDLEQK